MIEIINRNLARGQIRCALFDFDGTISLVRRGWQDVMIPMMVEALLETPEHEDEATVTAIVTDYVTRLTGKESIYQMMALTDEIRKRGGQPLEPLAYKHMYRDRFLKRVGARLDDLRRGRIGPDDLMVPGSREFLETLVGRGVICYLASATDEPFVRGDAAELGIASCFAGIYGAKDDHRAFSKKMVIERIMSEHRLCGEEFASFGDGFVEIEEAKRVRGIAIGVASDETQRDGIDGWKRNRLIKAGADLIVPDFREHKALDAYLWGE